MDQSMHLKDFLRKGILGRCLLAIALALCLLPTGTAYAVEGDTQSDTELQADEGSDPQADGEEDSLIPPAIDLDDLDIPDGEIPSDSGSEIIDPEPGSDSEQPDDESLEPEDEAALAEEEQGEDEVDLMATATPASNFYYSNDSLGVRITGYKGSSKSVVVPKTIGGKNVISVDFSRVGTISTLDVSQCTALVVLQCDNNFIYSLNVSKNTALTKLTCSNTFVSSLDVSKNTKLQYLDYEHTKITKAVDTSKNKALVQLYCDGNQLKSLDVSKNAKLAILSCNNNQLAKLDLRNNKALVAVSCYFNTPLTSLSVTGCSKLVLLDCAYGSLSSLDLTGCSLLEELHCYNNRLGSLKISGLTKLKALYCHNNKLTALDISKNSKLTVLQCNGNYIKSTKTLESWAKASGHAGKVLPQYASGKTGTLTGFAGAGRYDTALMVAKASTAKNGGATYKGVIVASGEGGKFADALSAAGLSGLLDYPIVLTNGTAGSLSSQARSAIQKLSGGKKINVIVLGSESTVSRGVAKDLGQYDKYGYPTRLGGRDRYETNTLIYNYGINRANGWNMDNAIIATGTTFPDALGISSYAAASASPIILVDPKASSLPATDIAALNQYRHIVVLGGEASVSSKVYSQIAKKVGSSNIERIAGANRYETSVKCARWQLSHGMVMQGAGFATGENFPDALASGYLLSKTASVLMLASPSKAANTGLENLLKEKGLSCTEINVFGSDKSISNASRTQITKALGWSSYKKTNMTTKSDGEDITLLEDAEEEVIEEEIDVNEGITAEDVAADPLVQGFEALLQDMVDEYYPEEDLIAEGVADTDGEVVTQDESGDEAGDDVEGKVEDMPESEPGTAVEDEE